MRLELLQPKLSESETRKGENTDKPDANVCFFFELIELAKKS